jgi:hypothetical protein
MSDQDRQANKVRISYYHLNGAKSFEATVWIGRPLKEGIEKGTYLFRYQPGQLDSPLIKKD